MGGTAVNKSSNAEKMKNIITKLKREREKRKNIINKRTNKESNVEYAKYVI